MSAPNSSPPTYAHSPSLSSHPAGPPPRYAAVVQRMYPYSLRPVLIFTSLLGFIWAIAEGVQAIKARNNANESSQKQKFDLVLAVLFFIVAGIELFGGAVALLQNLRLGRLLNILAPVGVIVALVSQLMALVLHFTLKSDLLNQCQLNTVGQTLGDGLGGTTVITSTQATNICNNAWTQSTWTLVAWLVVTAIASLVFASVAMAYYRQLVDPSLVRQRMPLGQAQAYQMQPPPGAYYPSPAGAAGPGAQQPWMVPPYPGPPAQQPQTENIGFEKGDYHPDVEWASAGSDHVDYAPPAGAPPTNPFAGNGRDGASSVTPNRAEDDAWERARSGGVTAHLTGHASPPPAQTGGGGSTAGYVIHNNEEDDAWEKARSGGVTAHLTGHDRAGSARDNEGEL